MKIENSFWENVKFRKFSTESETFSEIGRKSETGGMHHCLRGMDALDYGNAENTAYRGHCVWILNKSFVWNLISASNAQLLGRVRRIGPIYTKRRREIKL